MHKIVPATALAVLLALATPTWAAADTDGDTVVVQGADRGTFTTTMIDDIHVLTADQAVGRARPVGRYAIEASEVINLATFEVSEGAFTMTTRRGVLTGSYSGSAAGTTDPNVITYHAAGPIAGVTGRFAGVTGWIVFDGVANLATGRLCDAVSGWLSETGEGADDRRLPAMPALRRTQACRL